MTNRIAEITARVDMVPFVKDRNDIKYLLSALTQAQRERDAAISDMKFIHCAGRNGCKICLNNDVCKKTRQSHRHVS